jgi:NAD(P)-dependent dehydrogenase (short-subunit alcohol dehydrogenase family)
MDIRDDLKDTILNEINLAGGHGYFYKCDISNSERISETIKLILKDHQYIDVLINNAGILSAKYFKDTTIEDFRRVMNVNYLGPVQITQLILPIMFER